ncbi:MAG: hypothetical protein Kow0069_33070 [Promethearchaeota archaeon]
MNPRASVARYARSPWLWLGVAIRVVVTWSLFRFGADLNDMNEQVLLADLELLSGRSPYAKEYTLTILGTSYAYRLSYPPLALLVYLLPVAVYPVTWGPLQFHLPTFLLNASFTFLTTRLFVGDGTRRLSSAVGWVCWCLPTNAYMEYCSFYSLVFLLIVLTLRNLNDPFRGLLYATTGVFTYHLLTFLLPVVLFYQVTRLGRPAPRELERVEAPDLPRSAARTPAWLLREAWNCLREDATPLKEALAGVALPLLASLAFIAWDFEGTYASLVQFQVERFSLESVVQLAIAVGFVVLAGGLLFVVNPTKAELFALVAAAVTLFLEAAFLHLFDVTHYAHYYALAIPAAFVIVQFVGYQLVVPRKVEKKEAPSPHKTSETAGIPASENAQ